MRTIKLIISAALFVIAATALFFFVAGCGQQAGNEKLKAAYIQASQDAYNKGEMNALDTLVAADVVRHNPPEPDIKGLDAYKKSIVEIRRVYPDFQLTTNSMIMEGNTSASRWTVEATETSTGKQVKVTGCVMYQWVNGKAVECWHHGDYLGMFQQLGYKMSPPITENTLARVTVVRVKPEKVEETLKIYRESVVPAVKSLKGMRGIYLLSDFKTGKMLSIGIWDSEADVISYEQSGVSQAQLDKFKGLFTAKPIRELYTLTVQE
ncbi:MAG: ester cyclase [Candidatus Latescibacter sp.]|nr:ester cyclase [Candidatus Latescibacter sp.]